MADIKTSMQTALKIDGSLGAALFGTGFFTSASVDFSNTR